MCMLGDRAEPVFGVPGTIPGIKDAERLPAEGSKHLPRWDRAASPSVLKSLANGFQAQEVAAPGHPTACLHFQREERKPLPSPSGKLEELPPVGGVSVVLGLKGA